jgi:hypothetical protein
MIMALNIHYSPASDILVPDRLTTNSSVPLSIYRDSFGNLHTAFGSEWKTDDIKRSGVSDSGSVDTIESSAQQHSIEELPEETLVFLLGSRYCDSPGLGESTSNL